ncbi:MAG: hypothetical protein RIR23_863, partial [Pseudomonadota bacterium]
ATAIKIAMMMFLKVPEFSIYDSFLIMLSLKVSVYTHTLLGRHDIRKFTNLKATECLEK